MKRIFIIIGIGALIFIAFFIVAPTIIHAGECTKDSISNYFPRTSIESFVGISATSITGKGINYTCNGGSLTYNFQLDIGNGDFYKYKIYVALFKESVISTAHNRYLEQSDISYQSGGIIKSDQRTKTSLGIGDESTLITNPDYGNEPANPNLVVSQLGVIRKDNAVFVVSASVIPNGNGIPASLSSKFNASNVASEIKSLLSQAAGEPDRYSQPNSSPSAGGTAATGSISCPQTTQYFPLSRVESVFGKKIGVANEFSKSSLEKLKRMTGAFAPNNSLFSNENIVPGTLDWAACYIYFGLVSGQVSLDQVITNFTKMDSIENAHAMIAGLTTSQNAQATLMGQENIGDEGSLYKISGGYIGYNMIVRKGTIVFGVIYVNPNDKAKAEELLRIVVGDSQSPTEQPSPNATSEVTDQAPTVTTFEPDTISAGIEQFNEQSGIVSYKDNLLILKLEGKYLFGGQLTTNNTGVDGRPGIEFRATQINGEGTSLQVQVIAKPTAKDGPTTFTLTNNSGKSTTFIIGVTITGTQYLQRTFADYLIIFKGDWPDVAPNGTVLELESIIKSGLAEINYPSYQRLQIVPVIFEASFWNSHAILLCGNIRAVGCASPANGEIRIKESDETDMTIVHESAHKLHFYYNGIYKGVPNAPKQANDFQREWIGVAQPVDSANCQYLPLKTATIFWNDGTDMVPHCGFVRSYGASDLRNFFEDIATTTEIRAIQVSYFDRFPETRDDARYQEKVSLLTKYEFLH